MVKSPSSMVVGCFMSVLETLYMLDVLCGLLVFPALHVVDGVPDVQPVCYLRQLRAPCNPDKWVDPEEHVSGEHEIRDRDEHHPPDHHGLQEFPGPILGWGKRRRIFASSCAS